MAFGLSNGRIFDLGDGRLFIGNAYVLFWFDTFWFFGDIDSVRMAIFYFAYVVDRRTDIFQARTERETVEIPGDMPIPVSRDAIEFEAQDFRAVQTVLLTGISGHDVLAAELGNDSVDQVFPCASARVHAVAITGLAIEKELVGILQVAVSRIE